MQLIGNKNNPDSLEAMADKLLKKAGRDAMFPAYPEKYLLAQSRRHGEESLESMFGASGITIPKAIDIFAAKWPDIKASARASGCTVRQIECFELYCTGWTQEEIANEVHWSRRTVREDLRIMSRRMLNNQEFWLLVTLAEVFHERRDVIKSKIA